MYFYLYIIIDKLFKYKNVFCRGGKINNVKGNKRIFLHNHEIKYIFGAIIKITDYFETFKRTVILHILFSPLT